MPRQPAWLPAALLGLTLVVSIQTPAGAQDLKTTSRELSDVEAFAGQLSQVPLRGSDLRSATYVEERLTDGELYFRLADYVRASIIFTDLVENHAKHKAYPDALFLLAESLFHAGDFLGARSRYRMVLDHADEGAYRPHVQRSLSRLIEIAIRIRDFDGVDRYFERLARLPPSEIEAATTYFRAKYLYSIAAPLDLEGDPNAPLPPVNADALEQARLGFEAVAENSPYYAQARYFIGVIYTLRAQYGQGIDAFARVTRLKPSTEEQRAIVELAQLGLGRLLYETDALDRAIEAYQAIPRTSQHFDTALYEIAWTYLRQGDSTRAEQALEVLSVAAPDSRYIPDGKVLRGNLLLREGRLQAATTVFNEVTTEFQPVRDALDQQVAKHEDPHAYFKTLVRENIDLFDPSAFIPPVAMRWATVEGDMARALAAVSDLSQARRLTKETGSIVDRLQAAIRAENRVNVFSDLRRQRERTLSLRNRLALVRKDLIAALASQNRQVNSAELAEVRGRRAQIERALAGLPLEDSDFQDRKSSVDKQFVELSKQLRELDVQLLGLDARIVATDRYISETMREPEQQAGVEAYRAELATQAQVIGEYRAQLEQLSVEVEAGRIQVGVGDANFSRDDQLRNEHEDLVVRERALVASLGGKSTNLDALFARADAAERLIDAHDVEIDKVVMERVQDMQRVLDEERGKLDGYRARLVELDAETEDVVGGIAYDNYRQVQKRFYDLVLKADVGIIDVGWAEREEHRTRIDLLTRDRTRAMQALDDEFREIMDERGQP